MHCVCDADLVGVSQPRGAGHACEPRAARPTTPTPRAPPATPRREPTARRCHDATAARAPRVPLQGARSLRARGRGAHRLPHLETLDVRVARRCRQDGGHRARDDRALALPADAGEACAISARGDESDDGVHHSAPVRRRLRHARRCNSRILGHRGRVRRHGVHHVATDGQVDDYVDAHRGHPAYRARNHATHLLHQPARLRPAAQRHPSSARAHPGAHQGQLLLPHQGRGNHRHAHRRFWRHLHQHHPMPARQRAHDARSARPHRVAGGGVLHLGCHHEPLCATALPRESLLDCRHQHTRLAARRTRRDAQSARQRPTNDETRASRVDVRQLRARTQNQVPTQARRNAPMAPGLRRPGFPHRPAWRRHGRCLWRRNGRLHGLGEQHVLLRE